MDINWYPGHIAKAQKIIREHSSLVDIILHVVDARAPYSTHIPNLEKITPNKKIITILNKKDLADTKITFLWLKKFKSMGIAAVDVNSLARQGFDILHRTISEKAPRKKVRATRCMVVGVPNVGKSAILNQMARRKAAKTGNRPGLTKSKMWLKAGNDLELLDTPEVLLPSYQDKKIGIKLALLGCIKREVLDVYQLSYNLIEYLSKNYPENIKQRYKVDTSKTAIDILNQIARNRGFLKAGGTFDIERSIETLLTEFQQGKLGRISLEKPDFKRGLCQ